MPVPAPTPKAGVLGDGDLCVCVNLPQVQDLDLCRLAVQASALSSPRALPCACCRQKGKRQLVGRKKSSLAAGILIWNSATESGLCDLETLCVCVRRYASLPSLLSRASLAEGHAGLWGSSWGSGVSARLLLKAISERLRKFRLLPSAVLAVRGGEKLQLVCFLFIFT